MLSIRRLESINIVASAATGEALVGAELRLHEDSVDTHPVFHSRRCCITNRSRQQNTMSYITRGLSIA